MSKKQLSVAGAALLVLSLAACSSEDSGLLTAASPMPPVQEAGHAVATAEGLMGTWFLETMEPAGAAAVPVGEPERYVARFESEGLVTLRSDCNRCAGGYNATTTALRFSPLACTRAYCGEASLDSRFERVLGVSERWSVEGSRLTLDGSAGRLVFVR
jgi:heat shock protein HslJ